MGLPPVGCAVRFGDGDFGGFLCIFAFAHYRRNPVDVLSGMVWRRVPHQRQVVRKGPLHDRRDCLSPAGRHRRPERPVRCFVQLEPVLGCLRCRPSRKFRSRVCLEEVFMNKTSPMRVDSASTRMTVACADCGCSPLECSLSNSPESCPNCAIAECCCWDSVRRI
jgi:hypothetical protein